MTTIEVTSEHIQRARSHDDPSALPIGYAIMDGVPTAHSIEIEDRILSYIVDIPGGMALECYWLGDDVMGWISQYRSGWPVKPITLAIPPDDPETMYRAAKDREPVRIMDQ